MVRECADWQWTNAIQRKCGDDCAIDVQFKVAKWVFVGCIIFSFLLVSPPAQFLRDHCSRAARIRDIQGEAGHRIEGHLVCVHQPHRERLLLC